MNKLYNEKNEKKIGELTVEVFEKEGQSNFSIKANFVQKVDIRTLFLMSRVIVDYLSDPLVQSQEEKKV